MKASIIVTSTGENFSIRIDSKEVEKLVNDIQCQSFFKLKKKFPLKINAIGHHLNNRIFYCTPWYDV